MRKAAAGLFMSLILLSAFAAACNESEDTLKVFAVKYGKSLFPQRFIYYKDAGREKLPFCWLFYYIEYKDRKILVDTGFNDEKLIKMFEITDYVDPVSILEENGIEPGSITDIIITHAHFDHIGNAHRFKNARIIINKKEFDSFMKGTGVNDVRNFLKNNQRVHTFDESITLFDFFRIQKIGGHSSGSSVIFFTYKNSGYCLTGDEIYSEDNISSMKGNGSVYDHDNNMKFISEIGGAHLKPLIFHDNRFYNDNRSFIKILPD